jgi:hypothetical protein
VCESSVRDLRNARLCVCLVRVRYVLLIRFLFRSCDVVGGLYPLNGVGFWTAMDTYARVCVCVCVYTAMSNTYDLLVLSFYLRFIHD